MEIRNGGEALKAFLGISSPQSANGQPISRQGSDQTRAAFVGDQATLSAVGTKVSDGTGDGVRMDRVAAVQAALATGTYRVDPEKVAEKVIDAMRAGGV